MRRNGRFSFKASESGSTLLEVIAAMAILSILGVGAWNAVAVSIRIAGRIHDNAIASARLLTLDDRVRSLMRRVRVPFWAAQTVETDDGGARVSFLDGDPAKIAALSFKDGILTVGDGASMTQFTEFAKVDFSPASDAENNVFGIQVSVTTKDGREVSVVARFGSTPMGSGTSP
jgi:prepilin-type N-terminal cleavage/methylation domain-containing protein